MYKKILVPLDGSELSESSLQYAKTIAAGCGVTELVLLSVIEPVTQMAAYLSESWLKELEERNRAAIENYLTKIASKLRSEGMAIQTAIARGNPAKEILSYACDNRIDLIIMSTHGSSGITRWFIGSIARKVVRHSAIPVLMIPLRSARTTGDLAKKYMVTVAT